MKTMLKMFAGAALCACIAVPASYAAAPQDHQPAQHDDGGYVRHDEWKKGAKIAPADWNRGQQVDYKSHHLNAPPKGYEWRSVDGNYVLAAAATGLIASAIVASTVR